MGGIRLYALPETFLAILAADGESNGRPSELAGGALSILPDELSSPPLIAERQVLVEHLHLATEQNRQLEQRVFHLMELAMTDDLTRLKNRRHFHEALDSELSFSVRQRQPLTVMLVDVDHFKAYNDTHGHQSGDAVLRIVAETLRLHVRAYDVVARYGGDEFALLLPTTDAHAGWAIAERLRTAIERHEWRLRPVTVSMGVVTMHSEIMSAAELMEQADKALYHAKRGGRNGSTHMPQ